MNARFKWYLNLTRNFALIVGCVALELGHKKREAFTSLVLPFRA